VIPGGPQGRWQGSRMMPFEAPASAGVQGPGETTR
jgi:hypothetical protein